MIAFKAFASLTLALLLIQPFAALNDCCPWTRSCKCPKGMVIFEKPWECVNNTLTNSQAENLLTSHAEDSICELKIFCHTTDNSMAIVFIIPAMFFLGILVYWFAMFVRSENWIYSDDQNVEGQHSARNGNSRRVHLQNRATKEDINETAIFVKHQRRY